MRLSVNLLCETGFVDESHRQVLELARRSGFDGVEIPVLSGQPTDYERLAELLDSLDLPRTATAVTPSPEASPVSPDPDIRAAGRKHLDWIMDCAEALKAEAVGGPFHAPIGHFTGTGPTEDELAYGAESHRVMAERAAANDQILALEPLNRFETYFLNTMQQAHAYARRVDHPAFKIMYDTFHAHIEERDPLAAIDEIAEYLGVFHASENDRGIPGTGQVDFDAAFARLRQHGFDGWVVVEAFGTGVPELAAATRVWRPLFRDTETLLRESASFMHRHIRRKAA